MPVTIGAGHLSRGGAIVETAGGTKVSVALVSVASGNISAYQDIDGSPSQIGATQTGTMVHGSGSVGAVHAVIDSTDIVHVFCVSPSAGVTRYLSYNTISDPDGTPAWGTWTGIQAETDGAVSPPRVFASIDSNDDLHVLYSDSVKYHGTPFDVVRYTENSAGWSAPVTVQTTQNTNLLPSDLSVDSADDVHAVYGNDGTNGPVNYKKRTSGSWGTEVSNSSLENRGTLAVDGTTPRFVAMGTDGLSLYEGTPLGSVSDTTYNGTSVVGIAFNHDYYIKGATPERYILYVDGSADVRAIKNVGAGWVDMGALQIGTYSRVVVNWAYNNLNTPDTQIDYIFDDGTTLYYDSINLAARRIFITHT